VAKTINRIEIEEEPVRERLLQAATDLFLSRGYAGTSVREIVAAAGVTKPVLYYYFKSKEGVYLELMNRTRQRFLATLDEARQRQGTVVERLLKLVDDLIGLCTKDIKAVRLIHSVYYGLPQDTPYVDFQAFHVMLHEAVNALVAEGIGNGEFRQGDPQEMTWALSGALHMAIEVELNHPELTLGRAGLARVMKMIFNGIAAQPV